jgi:hypothetical protein
MNLFKKRKPKRQEDKSQQICECPCCQCDIGAHERCGSSLCQMPKWGTLNEGKEN